MISFFVHGIPKPAGSKRGIPIYRGHQGKKEFTGHVAVIDDCKGSRNWKTTCSWAAKEAMMKAGLQPSDKPLSLELLFVMPRAKYHFGSGKNALVLKPSAPFQHVIKPDTTKLLRGVEDALTGIVWKDDCQIISQSAWKVYVCNLFPQHGVHITVKEM